MSAGEGHRTVRRRRWIQAAAVLGWIALPLTGVLRVDLVHLRIVIAGATWPPLVATALPADALARGAVARWDVIGPLIAASVLPVVLVAAAFLLMARRFGRVHCGYSCVYGAFAEHGEAIFRWAGAAPPGPARTLRLAAAWLLVAAAAPLVAFVILTLFLGTAGAWAGLCAGNPAVWVPFGVLTTVALLMGGIVRLRFCRHVCGVGLVQTLSWLTNPKALEVGFHAAPAADGSHGSMRDCTGCHGCRDVCPIGLDPRAPKRAMLACMQCGLCVARCEDELHPLGKGASLGFHLADPAYPLPAQVPPDLLVQVTRARPPAPTSERTGPG